MSEAAPPELREPAPSFAGTPPFPKAARTALADNQLRANLGRATRTIRDKRARAVAELDDWEGLRLAGAAIKDDVLARLPELLVRLEANVQAAGGVVHWARDAAEANATVVDIVRTAGAREVVKVKSMVTQEIELNEALAREGIAAWETDLAELIVQLGRDLPSHILVPAIHRNRTEIRDIFAREMAAAGRPAPADLSDDPRALAEAARLHLREKFLRARVAISGANFAIAETGTVMVVESEGNGRMCLTLPDTLITVMGVEKLLPRWQDLEVFLQLLPRSSTAERMNPYTSMWTGVTPGDGPQAFHLILLDAGRTDTLSDPVGRQALRCIRCSACLNVCPVYERAGGRAYGSPYPGPIGAIITPQLRGIARHPVDAQTSSLPYASSLCGACFDACPVRIDIPEVLVHLRGQVVAHGGVPNEERVMMGALGWAFRSPRRLGRAERLAGLGGRVIGRDGRIGRLRLPGMLGRWFRWRDLPAPARQSFRAWWRKSGSAGDER
jgi:L-lactate dehydrogenase complex protein LldF